MDTRVIIDGYTSYLLNKEAELNNFINYVKRSASLGCVLPFSISNERMKDIIELAKVYFYDNVSYALEQTYVALPSEYLVSTKFSKVLDVNTLRDISIEDSKEILTKKVNPYVDSYILPDRIKAVSGVYILNGGYSGENNSGVLGYNSEDPSFFLDRVLFSNFSNVIPGSSHMGGLMHFTTTMLALDSLRQAFMRMPSFTYNRLTNHFKLNGSSRGSGPVVIEAWIATDEALYKDQLFQRYVIAKVKEELIAMMSVYTFKLPGNVELNIDALSRTTETELSDIKESIDKDQSTADWFFTI